MKELQKETINAIRRVMFAACLLPFGRLLADALTEQLGSDPVAHILATTGVWSLNLLLGTLAFTPIRKLIGCNWIMRLRRTVALYSFFYASLHLSAYLVFEHAFDVQDIARDLIRRPHVTAGWLAFLAMLPLAITSTNTMMKRLGGRRWKVLHRLTYLVGISGAFHYLWLVKRDITVPGYYAIVLLVLLAARCVKLPILTRPQRREPVRSRVAGTQLLANPRRHGNTVVLK